MANITTRLVRGDTTSVARYMNTSGYQGEIALDVGTGHLFVRGENNRSNSGVEFVTQEYAELNLVKKSENYADTSSHANLSEVTKYANLIDHPNNISSVSKSGDTAQNIDVAWKVSSVDSTVSVTVPWLSVDASGLVYACGTHTLKLVSTN